ncbi:YolD-like family protein [Bacillus andreraoultii]|uniref:YolD-like family protein n=1 Tax=Bacillus andreraoultii TaxID=1499685 RepID=UPI00053B9511|nr:YolD-like family protein [Bacillus andreraoultii]
MIRDRGRIKWTAMMLPEHVQLLREWANEDSWEKSTELDEQQLEVFNEIIFSAKEMRKKVAVQYYTGHHYKTLIGHIRSLDTMENTIQVVSEEGTLYSISLAKISDIEHAE